MELPTQKRKAVSEDPKFMILFGKQKCGKTTLLSELNDCLIVDFEEGTRFVDAMTVPVPSFAELTNLLIALGKAKKEKEDGSYVYKYIALDTASTMEDIIMPYAVQLYKETPMGKSFKGNTVRILPNGAGYLYEREAFKKVIDAFLPYCETLILTGHVSDKQVERNGQEVWEMELDLTGKLKKIIGARADAIGYVFRKKNQTIISFKGGDEAIIESRPRHLSNKDIVVAESIGEGEDMDITVHWDRIFKH